MSNQIISICRALPPPEVHPDGSPYTLTPDQLRRVKSMVRKQCCNCADGCCLVLDDGEPCICPQLISQSIICRWFRRAVLPADPELEAEIYQGDEPDSGMKRCAVCGRPFVPKSNRAKYCAACGAQVRRRQKEESRKRAKER